MKKKITILLLVILALIIIGTVYYFTPKTFGKGVDAKSVDHINVFDGNTGEGFTIDNPDDIQYIVENIQSKTMRRNGISLGHMGYRFSVVFIDENDNAIVPIFFINSESTIRKDPFFYDCDGGLCVEYLNDLENEIVACSIDSVFQARILEINDGSYLVEPVEGSQELKSSDKITVPIIHMDASMEPEVGDLIEIIYSGEIMETYPARLQNVSSIRIVSEIKEGQWALIPMVMVDGELYLDTGMESNVDGRCGVMDGEITSSVDGTKKPTRDGESNFGTGYGYQYGQKEGTIEIYMNEKWRVFATEEVRQEIQFPEKSID